MKETEDEPEHYFKWKAKVSVWKMSKKFLRRLMNIMLVLKSKLCTIVRWSQCNTFTKLACFVLETSKPASKCKV